MSSRQAQRPCEMEATHFWVHQGGRGLWCCAHTIAPSAAPQPHQYIVGIRNSMCLMCVPHGGWPQAMLLAVLCLWHEANNLYVEPHRVLPDTAPHEQVDSNLVYGGALPQLPRLEQTVERCHAPRQHSIYCGKATPREQLLLYAFHRGWHPRNGQFFDNLEKLKVDHQCLHADTIAVGRNSQLMTPLLQFCIPMMMLQGPCGPSNA